MVVGGHVLESQKPLEGVQILEKLEHGVYVLLGAAQLVIHI